MQRVLLIFSILILKFSLWAQKPLLRFGDISPNDLRMIAYEYDSSAEAVILEDYGRAYFSINRVEPNLFFERHVRIKILKRGGLSWADVIVPLYHYNGASEEIGMVKAATYNYENGRIVESRMSHDGVFKEDYNKFFKLYTFTLPNVKEGSVIEFTYTITSDFLANFPNWQFQYQIPVRHSEYEVGIPEFFIMEKFMQGYVVPAYEVKDIGQIGYREKKHRWTIDHVPAFKEESFVNSQNNYISRINFSLAYIKFPNDPHIEIMGSWKKLNDDLLEHSMVGSHISGAHYLDRQVEEMTKDEKSPLEKARKLFDYVRNTIEWNGRKEFFASKPKEVLEKKQGSSGDINILLASLLTKAGLSVDLVLLSTKDHGFIREQYPMVRYFNYVVCALRIEGKVVLLDATERYLPWGVLPDRCINGKGLIISKSFHGWMELDSKSIKSKTIITATLKIISPSELTGSLAYLHEGYDAHQSRGEINKVGQTDYVKKKFLDKGNWEITLERIENVTQPDHPVKEDYRVVVADHISQAGNLIYLNPFIIGRIEQNPFKARKRDYPVHFGSRNEKIVIHKYEIPVGYAVDELPAPKLIGLPGGAARFSYNVTVAENIIQVVSSVQINQEMFSQEEYENLREFYNRIISKQAEEIILKKI